jgi:ERCC4-type nuclease
MTIVVVIDNRERALIAAMKKKKQKKDDEEVVVDEEEEVVDTPHIEVEALDIGDIQFRCSCEDTGKGEGGEGGELLVLERKTHVDMIASVKDGRYLEQKKRALSHLGQDASRFAYIFEGYGFTFGPYGDMSHLDQRDAKMLQSCVVNSMVRDGVRFFWTRDIQETAALIWQIATRASATKNNYFFFHNNNNRGGGGGYEGDSSFVYKSTLQVKRRGNLCDARTIAELQIAQVPGVSVRMADAILTAFSVRSLFELASALAAMPCDKTRIKYLTRVDKVGKKKALDILAMLFPPPVTLLAPDEGSPPPAPLPSPDPAPLPSPDSAPLPPPDPAPLPSPDPARRHNKNDHDNDHDSFYKMWRDVEMWIK